MKMIVGHQILRRVQDLFLLQNISEKVFKNGPSKICGREPLKDFTGSILGYFVPYVVPCNSCYKS